MRLRRDGHRVILVSSGAIGIGLRRLDIEHKPKQLSAKQVFKTKTRDATETMANYVIRQLQQ